MKIKTYKNMHQEMLICLMVKLTLIKNTIWHYSRNMNTQVKYVPYIDTVQAWPSFDMVMAKQT